MERLSSGGGEQRQQVTVLIPHGNLLGEIAFGQRNMCRAFAPFGQAAPFYRFMPLCCFLSDAQKGPEWWKKEITACRILPPVCNGNMVMYPVELCNSSGIIGSAPFLPSFARHFLRPAAPISGIITGFLNSPDFPETGKIPQDFAARTLRVFRLCTICFSVPDPGRPCYFWSIDKTLWVRLDASAVIPPGSFPQAIP
jgi:hypothetical protein